MVCLCLYALAFTAILIVIRLLLEKIQLRGLNGRPVLITGCDTGFGYHLALKLLRKNVPVFAGCLTEKGEENLKKEAKGLEGRLATFHLDVTKQDSVDKAFEFVTSQTTGLWALVNNAGVLGPICPDDWTTVEDYNKVLEVNTFGVIRMCQRFKPLVKRRQGRIVNIASTIGRVAPPSMGPYAVSKFAVEGYCDTLRLELQVFKVSVHILEPGLFATGMLELNAQKAAAQRRWDGLSQNIKHEYGEEYFKRAQNATIEGLGWANKDINLVIDSYVHAVTSVFPRRRYWVGPDAQFFFIPFSLAPTCVQDWFWKIMGYAQKLPVPAAIRQ